VTDIATTPHDAIPAAVDLDALAAEDGLADSVYADAVPTALPEGVEARMAAAVPTTVGTLREPTSPEIWTRPDDPAIPAWIRDRETVQRWARGQCQRAWYLFQLHTVRRGPAYARYGAGRVARGTGRGLASLYGYLLATEYAHMVREARHSGQYDLVAALRHKRRAEIPLRFKSKRFLAPTGSVVVLLAVAAAYGLIVIAAVGLGLLAMAAAFKAGHHPDAVLDLAELGDNRGAIPDSDVLTGWFRDAGIIGKPAKDGTGGQTLRLVSPVLSDRNRAWEVVVDLPGGMKASAAIGKREDLASAIGVDEVQVHMERVRDGQGHAGRLSIWVAKEDPFATDAVRTPLLKRDAFDVWTDKVPVGLDARGREVAISLMWASLLVGAVPRQGKSFFVRQIALALALDPHVRFVVANGKGDRTFKAFNQVAHRAITGSSPAAAKTLRDALKEIQRDMNRRNDELNDLTDEEVPEDKLTRELSHRLKWPVTAIVLDEVQRYFDVPKLGEEILELLIDIAKVGPSTGYILLLATQRPDANTIPPALRDVIVYRAALKVMDWRSSETVLGAGTYTRGYDASTDQLGSRKGMTLMVREDGIGQLLRGYFADATDAVAICRRGRKLREKAGTLTGDAVGESGTLTGPADLVELPVWLSAAIEAVEASGQPGLAPTDLVNAVLAAADGELPDDDGKPLTARTFGMAMTAMGVTKAKRDGSPAPWYWLDDLTAAAERITSGLPLADAE
jgi:S-DNA-T family DNA segregation ATPase FtsK/SpoIIIE